MRASGRTSGEFVCVVLFLVRSARTGLSYGLLAAKPRRNLPNSIAAAAVPICTVQAPRFSRRHLAEQT